MPKIKQPKINSLGTPVYKPNESQYTSDMFRGEHPCKLTEKQWVNQMDMAYPDLQWTKRARR